MNNIGDDMDNDVAYFSGDDWKTYNVVLKAYLVKHRDVFSEENKFDIKGLYSSYEKAKQAILNRKVDKPLLSDEDESWWGNDEDTYWIETMLVDKEA